VTVTGKVKWFSNVKGFGFLERDEDGADVFVHHSAIQMEGYRSLKGGLEVEFDVIDGPKGLQAQNVRRIWEA
jgi:cold shock protein